MRVCTPFPLLIPSPPTTMSPSKYNPADLKPTGKRFKSVDELMPDNDFPAEVVRESQENERQRRVTLQLARMRTRAGVTQEQIAERLGLTQSAVSKLENGIDDEVTLRHLRAYAEATGQRADLSVGKPPNHVQAIKFHALQVRRHMMELAKLAHRDAELERGIHAFYEEALVNILDILSECQNAMPNGDAIQMRLEVTETPGAVVKAAKAEKPGKKKTTKAMALD